MNSGAAVHAHPHATAAPAFPRCRAPADQLRVAAAASVVQTTCVRWHARELSSAVAGPTGRTTVLRFPALIPRSTLGRAIAVASALSSAPVVDGAASLNAQAPVTLTLSGARAAARLASPDVRAAREAVIAAAARERQASAYPNPTLAYGREQTSGSGQRNAQDVAQLEQAIELGGVRSARRDVMRLRREAAEARLILAESQVDLEATRAYAQAVAADRRAALAAQAASIFGQAATVSERRLAAGDVSGYAARRVRLETARYAGLRVEALLARRAARAALMSLVSTSPEEALALDVVLADSLVTAASEPAALDSLRASALTGRSEIRVAALEAEVAAAEARLVSRERMPVPVISAGFKTEEAAGSPQRLNGFVAGVALPLPLFDRRRRAIEAAEADARRRDAEAEAVRRRVTREVTEARDALVTVREQLALLEPQLGGQAAAALRAAEVAYAEGEITLVEWLDAVRAYQEAEATYATLRADAIVRQAALERAVGASLPSITSSGAAAPGNDR